MEYNLRVREASRNQTKFPKIRYIRIFVIRPEVHTFVLLLVVRFFCWLTSVCLLGESVGNIYILPLVHPVKSIALQRFA